MEKIAEFSNRLLEALSGSMTATQLAEKLGMSKQTISAYTTGTRSPKRPVVYVMAEILHVNPLWLLGYDVSKYDIPLKENLIPPGFDPLPPMSSIPLVGRIACGDPITAEENIEDMVSIPAKWDADFTLMCRGDSMAPKILDGDLVAIRIQPEVENGEIAAVRIENEATLKRVYLHPDYIELRPENTSFESIIRRRDEMNDVHIEGKAVGICRGL